MDNFYCCCCLGWLVWFPGLVVWTVLGRVFNLRKKPYVAGIVAIVLVLVLLVVFTLLDLRQDAVVQQPFREAVAAGNVTKARTYLQRGADPDDEDVGYPPIVRAAEDGDTEIVRLLIEYKADLTWRDPFTGDTALSLARKNKHTEIVKMLKKAGATR